MNKKKIGMFLKKLRLSKVDSIGKNWSQEYLSNKFYEVDLNVSMKAISDWENGKTIPELEKLLYLSELYDVSIEEILDGEKYTNKDFYKEYIFANENWFKFFTEKDDIYTIRQKEIIKVNKRFKVLLIKKINREETRIEEEEFKFLFEHFYML